MRSSKFDQARRWLKDPGLGPTDFLAIDQYRGVPAPPLEKPFAAGAHRIDLCPPGQWRNIADVGLQAAIGRRRSRRSYSPAPLGMDELAFLLWATQGVCGQLDSATVLRTVPSAGARHALETYVCAFRVEGIPPAVYRYLPLEHQLLFEFHEEGLEAKLAAAAGGQTFVGRSAATLVWTAVPYRMEWRYGPAAHKAIALEAGHVCQNLYLACEAISAGACAVGIYHQTPMDRLLRIDGKDEFAVYLAAVGKLPGSGSL